MTNDKENNLLKNVKYAFSQIFFIVISILIALQVDNWNQNRLDQLSEQDILANLHSEFKLNQTELNEQIKFNTRSFEAGKTLMLLMGQDKDVIYSHQCDSLIFVNLDYDKFTSTENALYDLIDSGRLNLLKNTKLKSLLFKWSLLKNDADFWYENIDHKADDMVRHLSKSFPFRDIDRYGELDWHSKSKLATNKWAVFHDLEYENRLDNFMYALDGYIKELISMSNVVEAILRETQP